MEAGIGSFALWVPGFRVVTVALDRVLDSSVKRNHQAKECLSESVLISICVSSGILRIGEWAAEESDRDVLAGLASRHQEESAGIQEVSVRP